MKKPQSFLCTIDSEKQVYDGDTIKDVKLEISIPALEIGFWVKRDIRISGIDTPEMRPRKAGRTKESLVREKQAAQEARHALIHALRLNNFKFEAHNVRYGKYAGRIIATVLVGDKNIAQHLIKLGHALPYRGRGPKPNFNF